LEGESGIGRHGPAKEVAIVGLKKLLRNSVNILPVVDFNV